MTATAVVATLPSPLSELGRKQATTLREYVSDKFNLPKSPFLVSNLKGFQFHYDKFISILTNLCPLNPMRLSKYSNSRSISVKNQLTKQFFLFFFGKNGNFDYLEK